MNGLLHVLYSEITPIQESEFTSFLQLMPATERNKIVKYIRWQDKIACLFGKLLLIDGLKIIGYESSLIARLEYTSYGRPYLPVDIDFNISHSGNYVICAIAKNMNLGVDIEEIKQIDLIDFQDTMNPDQWQMIHRDSDPAKAFFRFWTIKESIVKAIGKGLSIPFQDLEIFDNKIRFDGKFWQTQEINIHDNYSASIATSELRPLQLHKIKI